VEDVATGTVRNVTLIRCAGLAAVVGGALWAAKATAILSTGDQPEYIFQVAPLLFAVGLVGLHARLQGRGGGSARIGGGLAWACLALALSSAALYLATTDDGAFPLSATIPLTALSMLAALVLLGIAARRVEALTGRWRSLPLAIGAAAIPLMMVGGILGTLDERLLEIPILALGLAWIALGYALWSHARAGTGLRRG
jgi:NADH:ubiquinone oxidoreductase subunit K